MKQFLSFALIATAFLPSLHANAPTGAKEATIAAEAAAAAAKPAFTPTVIVEESHHHRHHKKTHMTPEDMAKMCMDKMTGLKERAINLQGETEKAETEVNFGKAEIEHKAILNPHILHPWKHKAACMRYLRKAEGILIGHHKYHKSNAVSHAATPLHNAAPAVNPDVASQPASNELAAPATTPVLVSPSTPAPAMAPVETAK